MSATANVCHLQSSSTIAPRRVWEEYTVARRCVQDRFVACKDGGMLLLKLTGLIEDEGAEILSVSESHITLQLGKPWYQRWGRGRGRERRRPVEVHIQFGEPGEDLTTWRTANARRSLVEVKIRPLTTTFDSDQFQRRADAIRHLLRQYFVADEMTCFRDLA